MVQAEKLEAPTKNDEQELCTMNNCTWCFKIMRHK